MDFELDTAKITHGAVSREFMDLKQDQTPFGLRLFQDTGQSVRTPPPREAGNQCPSHNLKSFHLNFMTRIHFNPSVKTKIRISLW